MSNQCRCRNEQRYYSVHCPNRQNHGIWAELPPFQEFIMDDAARYHESVIRDGTVKCIHVNHGTDGCVK